MPRMGRVVLPNYQEKGDGKRGQIYLIIPPAPASRRCCFTCGQRQAITVEAVCNLSANSLQCYLRGRVANRLRPHAIAFRSP